jgi:hypothetical protein
MVFKKALLLWQSIGKILRGQRISKIENQYGRIGIEIRNIKINVGLMKLASRHVKPYMYGATFPGRS